MLLQIISKGFLASLETIGQSLPTLVFWVLLVLLASILIWRRGGIMKDQRKKILESMGIAIVAWLPFFVWQLGYQTRGVECSYIVSFPTPPIPRITAALPTPEPKNSLRRRTMRLADEMQKYFVMRAENPNRPPVAIPNSNEPNPSDEQKKAIERYQKYQQETWDFYFAHYKDRMVGIIKEYDTRGVRTGYLESGASQRPPVIMMPGQSGEATYMDDLYQFRELAYHVDGEGNLIVITP